MHHKVIPTNQTVVIILSDCLVPLLEILANEILQMH